MNNIDIDIIETKHEFKFSRDIFEVNFYGENSP